MNRTDRLHAIGHALRTAGPRGRTAAWLAERFEVSSRTIKRDMAALLEAGLPIDAQDGRGGGYQWQKSAVLPPLSFTAAEATAIAIALSQDPSVPFAADGASALQQVLAAMNRHQRDQAADMARRVWMRSLPAVSRPACASVIDDGLRSQVCIFINYEDGKGQLIRRRLVEPMAFVRTRAHWQLLAYCHTRNAGRWFRLDRIRKATLTTQACQVRDLVEVFGPPPTYAAAVVLPR